MCAKGAHLSAEVARAMSPTVLLLDEIPPSPERDSAWMAELPEARRVQMEAWPDPRARHRSLLGSRLLRAGLTRLGYPADVLCRLRYGDSGKPSLDLPVAFSLSHCRGD
jgi:4'-phosphopantetheinyl transferase